MALSATDAAHLLRRVGFGGTAAEIQHFQDREIDDVVDEVVDLTPSLPANPAWMNRREWWEVWEDALVWWLDRMVDASWVARGAGTPSPLVEKLTLFWHGHFACGLRKVEDMSAMIEQNQLFRFWGMADFETLVQKISVSGAMLRYIDNETNVVGAEQENFARELMELHTCGIGNYTEADVIAMAKAWTGHNIVGWIGDRWDATYRFYPELHDNANKTLFGVTRNWDGPETVTELVKGSRQQATARFVATKLWRYFVNDTPPAGAIDELAAVWIANGMHVRELLRAMFSRPEFWAESSRRRIVRCPTEFVVDVFKRTGVPPREGGTTWLMPGMGQELFEPPNVAGWGTHGYWISTATSWGKGRFLGWLRWNDRIPARFGDLEHQSRSTAVANLFDRFGITDPSAATTRRVGDWFDAQIASKPWAVKHNALLAGAMTPEFQTA